MTTAKPSPAVPYVGPQHVGQEMLCAEDLSYAYPDGTLALEGVNLHVQRGCTLAVVGPNGAGKTTLLKILLGLLPGYRGKVEVAGMSPSQARRRGDVVTWIPQRARMVWDFPVTVEGVVRMGLVKRARLLGGYRRDDLDFIHRIMDVLRLTEIARRPIGEVSGGQQQRAIMARALAPRPAILMLDEPTVGIDQAGQQAFAELIEMIKQSFEVTLVLVSHDLRTVIQSCQRIACLNRSLHFHDSPSRLTPDVLADVFRCDLTGLFPAQYVGPSCPLDAGGGAADSGQDAKAPV
jgi:zinc transport system ATP-binding protein